MRAFTLVIAILCLAGACGGPSEPADPDADPGDLSDAGEPDAALAACSSIEVVASDLDAWRAATVDWLRDQGHAGARSERQYGDTVHIGGLQSAIAGDDLGAEARAWLVGLPDFPTPADEIEVVEVKQAIEGSATVVLARSTIGATPSRLFRPVASLLLSEDASGGWNVAAFTVWASTALMSEPEAVALEACSPAEPPPTDAIRATAFEGNTFDWCAIVDTYAYQPDELDTFEYDDAVEWVAIDGRWRARRGARVIIATANFWEGIAGADCYCDGVAGFELQVDATTGEVLDYRPGINCVVC